MKKLKPHTQAVSIYYSNYYLAEHKNYLTRSRVKKETDFLISKHGQIPSSICDIACGQGRHMQEFFARGVKKGYGFDANTHLIDLARNRLKNTDYKLEHTDFTSWQSSDKYDLVYTIFSSFGYCLNSKEAQDLINKMVQASHINGTIVVDVASIYQLIGYLETNYVSAKYDKMIFNPETMILETNYIFNNEILELKHRYFTTTELSLFLENSGIKKENIYFYGDFDSSKYSQSSNRLIVIAKK